MLPGFDVNARSLSPADGRASKSNALPPTTRGRPRDEDKDEDEEEDNDADTDEAETDDEAETAGEGCNEELTPTAWIEEPPE